MSYSVTPYLVRIDDITKTIGSNNRELMVAALKRKAKEEGEKFDENTLDSPLVPMNEDEMDDDDWNSWNTVAAVKALVNGDLSNELISGSQYGYALETLCAHLGKRSEIQSLESVHFSHDFTSYWGWFFSDQPLIPFSEYNDDFPTIGYLRLDKLPAEIQRTKELKFVNRLRKKDMTAKRPYKIQLDSEMAVFSAEYDSATVSPADFPWLDIHFYDSLQRALEALEFHYVRDSELRQLTRVFPNLRHFSRSLINLDKNIEASISQIRIVNARTTEERMLDIRCLEFSTEFEDGHFLVTTNLQGVNPPESIDGITFHNFSPDTSPEALLKHHHKAVSAYKTSTQTTVHTFATDDELISAGRRQQDWMKSDRQKKLQEYETEAAQTEPDDELIEWLEEIRTELLTLYNKAMKTKTDIVTFYY